MADALYSDNGRNKFRKYKSFLIILSKIYGIFPQKVRIRFLRRHRYMRGKFGMAIRYAILKSVARNCGDNVSIHEGVFLFHPENISFGENISIHPMCYIEGGEEGNEGISIGNDVSIAHGTTIICSSHNYQNSEISIKYQGCTFERVTINDNVWIGAKATILQGTTIASGCIIGAGSVVTKDTIENGIYAGVPAKQIKSR